MLSRALTSASRVRAAGRETVLSCDQVVHRQQITAKRRIDSDGPSIASGGMIALTREPSCSRASTIGDDSSMRRPTAETMLSMMFIRCLSSLKRTSVEFELAAPLDVDLMRSVDQDVRDGRVPKQRLQRAEPHHLVFNAFNDSFPLLDAERRGSFGHQAMADVPNMRPRLLFGQRVNEGQVHDVEQTAMDLLLPLLLERPRARGGSAAGLRMAGARDSFSTSGSAGVSRTTLERILENII